MRIVYGAGAVAAMSVMAVGLVQPDWTSTADQGPTDNSYAADPNAVAALPNGKAEAGPTDSTQGKGEGAANVKPRHVTRYVYLKPGQTAPPGATVVSATAPPSRGGRNHQSNPNPTATPRPAQHNGGGNNNGGGPVSATPRATPRPTQAPAATPRPTPQPTPKSRQSGHH